MNGKKSPLIDFVSRQSTRSRQRDERDCTPAMLTLSRPSIHHLIQWEVAVRMWCVFNYPFLAGLLGLSISICWKPQMYTIIIARRFIKRVTFTVIRYPVQIFICAHKSIRSTHLHSRKQFKQATKTSRQQKSRRCATTTSNLFSLNKLIDFKLSQLNEISRCEQTIDRACKTIGWWCFDGCSVGAAESLREAKTKKNLRQDFGVQRRYFFLCASSLIKRSETLQAAGVMYRENVQRSARTSSIQRVIWCWTSVW